MSSSRVIHNGPPPWLKKENKMQKPPEGFTTKATVVRVIDGDTVDVSITRRLRVRLQDCWAPETRTRDIVEKQKRFSIVMANGQEKFFDKGSDLSDWYEKKRARSKSKGKNKKTKREK